MQIEQHPSSNFWRISTVWKNKILNCQLQIVAGTNTSVLCKTLTALTNIYFLFHIIWMIPRNECNPEIDYCQQECLAMRRIRKRANRIRNPMSAHLQCYRIGSRLMYDNVFLCQSVRKLLLLATELDHFYQKF